MEKNSKPNPNASKVRKPFRIPDQFFAQLNEFSNGGFCLILVDDKGNPGVYSHFDSSIIALGIRKFALDYFKTMDEFEKEATESMVWPSCEEEDQE